MPWSIKSLEVVGDKFNVAKVASVNAGVVKLLSLSLELPAVVSKLPLKSNTARVLL